MCLGVPGCVVEVQEPVDGLAMALVEFAGVRRRICLACVPDARPGEYVIVHAGVAISRLDPEEAQRVFRFLEEAAEEEWGDEVR